MQINSIIISALALVLVLCLAWLVLKALSLSYRGTHKSQRIKLIESLPVTPKERVVVVRYHGHDYLLGVSGQSMTVIEKSIVDNTDIKASACIAKTAHSIPVQGNTL